MPRRPSRCSGTGRAASSPVGEAARRFFQTDSQGKFEATLVISSSTAGDNYRVTGAPNASFTCAGGSCPKSGTFTLWKRVYVEEERMFKQGSFIDDVAAAGSTEIAIADPAPFQGLAPGSVLELVHADRGAGEWFYSDQVVFKALTQRPSGKWVIELDPASALPRSYGSAPTGNNVDNIRRDGVGIVAAGVYEPSSAYVSPLLQSMFVDVVPARQTISNTPYVAEIDDFQRIYYSACWLQDGASLNAYSRHVNPNVLHRFGARQSPHQVRPGGIGVQLGITSVSGGSNHGFIYVQRIEDVAAARLGPIGAEYNGMNSLVINGETTVHETVHVWVHSGGADGNGHCDQVAYQSGLNCLLHTPYAGPGLADGLAELHYSQHGADSEYMTVRRAANPVPLQ